MPDDTQGGKRPDKATKLEDFATGRFVRAAGFLFWIVIILFLAWFTLVIMGRDQAAAQLFEVIKALIFSAAGLAGGYGLGRLNRE